ncbi:MAG: hypothetical protein M1393_08585 [Candidatus Thermoplasmatota archaeon]|nr:hypothetical protein [Candidatus Thermoplasmatota archaeon]MDA8144398.1 hypothetical protein [Thermoplasmatales archaeon]
MEDFYLKFSEIGKLIMEKLSSGENQPLIKNIVGIGADGTATHHMDKICEDVIINYVQDTDLPFNIMSEEVGFLDRGYEETLLTDPLDGTFNAENRIPFYSVSMATLIDDFNSLSRGFIMDLANGDSFYAEKGKGSKFNNRTIMVSKVPVRGYISSIGSGDDTLRKKIMELPGRHRYFGCASLEMALLAKGSVDLVAYIGDGSYIRNVDVAAGVMIVREAGGIVSDEHGGEFNMGLDVTVRRNMIAARNREILGELI